MRSAHTAALYLPCSIQRCIPGKPLYAVGAGTPTSVKSVQPDTQPPSAGQQPPPQVAHQDRAQGDDGSLQQHGPDAAAKPDDNHVDVGEAAWDSQHADDANGWDTGDFVLDELAVTEPRQDVMAGELQSGADAALVTGVATVVSSLSFSTAAAGPIQQGVRAAAADAGITDAATASRGSSGQGSLGRDRSIPIPSGAAPCFAMIMGCCHGGHAASSACAC